MKRPITLSGAIVAVCIASIQLLILLAALALTLQDLHLATETEIAVIVTGLTILIAFYTTMLVLSACTIAASFKKHEAYLKRKGLIIADVVFLIIIIIFQFFMSFGGLRRGMASLFLGSAWFFLSALALIMCVVFLIVDIARENNKVEKQNQIKNVEISKKDIKE